MKPATVLLSVNIVKKAMDHQKKKHTVTDNLENQSFVMEENTDIDLLNEAVIINMSQDEMNQFFMP